MLRKKVNRILIAGIILTGWFYWDLSQAGKKDWGLYRSYKMLSEFDTVTSATTKVAIVRSDDPELSRPVSVDYESIDYEQIEAMVRRAIDLAGGFEWVIKPGDKVLLKPNIVDPEPSGCGEITDVRVVKALIKIVDEISPGKMEIIVGEGSPRPMDYEMKYQSKFSRPCWETLWDVSGYQDLLTDPYLEGIQLRLSNLNGSPAENPWQDLVEVEVPGGGRARPQGGKYYIHKDVLNADVFITVPVMKIHDPGITVALKNQIGLAPSTMYGFSKTAGVPQDNYCHKLIHTSEAPYYWTDKEIVDLCHLAQIRFAVVDAIACLEQQKTAIWSGSTIRNLVRMNTIVAGADPVAVDHVCTRLMGMNPDDIEHITLAERVGLGTNNPENIHVVGADIESTMIKFIKNSASTAEFGQSNRIWLLSEPFSIEGIGNPIQHPFILTEADLSPDAGKNNWSDPVYFINDRIDLRDYYNNPGQVVSYAFSYFHAPADQEAELWIGSDEALKIYINGEVAYEYEGTRTMTSMQFVNEKVKIPIKAGINRLLVKSLQKYGRYDFCLNICEPEADIRLDGNRVWGLKFGTSAEELTFVSTPLAHGPVVESFRLHQNYPNPFNGSTTVSFGLSHAGQLSLKIHDMRGRSVNVLANGTFSSGEHTLLWDGCDDAGSPVSSGVYFSVLQVEERTVQNKMILLK
ncbi:DUF362 domain-containing protein [bacterium]|nr:DUF362 domain-containing protein [bacterium]